MLLAAEQSKGDECQAWVSANDVQQDWDAVSADGLRDKVYLHEMTVAVDSYPLRTMNSQYYHFIMFIYKKA